MAKKGSATFKHLVLFLFCLNTNFFMFLKDYKDKLLLILYLLVLWLLNGRYGHTCYGHCYFTFLILNAHSLHPHLTWSCFVHLLWMLLVGLQIQIQKVCGSCHSRSLTLFKSTGQEKSHWAISVTSSVLLFVLYECLYNVLVFFFGFSFQ